MATTRSDDPEFYLVGKPLFTLEHRYPTKGERLRRMLGETMPISTHPRKTSYDAACTVAGELISMFPCEHMQVCTVVFVCFFRIEISISSIHSRS